MTDLPSGTRRYLALWLPFLPTEAVAWRSSVTHDGRLILIEKTANAIRISAASPAALAVGLTPGLTLADARARVPDLIALDRDHAAEAALLERLADGCERYTPMVAIEPPDALILDISGCGHLFGSEAALAGDLRDRLERIGVTPRIAIGNTPDAARALARFPTPRHPREGGDPYPMSRQLRGTVTMDSRLRGNDDGERLLALPVAALEADPEITTALRRAGLRTLGDLAERPRAMLAARFGDLQVRLARILGEEDRRITPRRPPPAIQAARRFAEPIARVEDALAALEALAGEVAAELERRAQGGRRFEARLFRSDGAVRALRIETGRPTRDPALLMRLFRERIEALRDPIDPGFGFDLVRLALPLAEPLALTQPGLTDPPRAAESIDALIDRLGVRIGRDRLRRPLARPSHVPERAIFSAPVATETEGAEWIAPDPGEPPLRPLLLYDPPEPIETVAEVPDGAPHRFRWRGRFHDVVHAEGPERIAPEWWRRRWGKEGPTRDYYRVEDSAGHRFWLLRSGLFGGEDEPRWYIHGRFA